MELFTKAAAGILVALVLAMTIGKQQPDLALAVAVTACILAATTALALLEPVLDLLWELEEVGKLPEGVLKLLLKMAAISMLAETGAALCRDGGYASLGKGLELMGTVVILRLSVPVLRSLLELVRELLGEV